MTKRNPHKIEIKILTISASVLIIFLIGYFYVLEFTRNWTALHNYRFNVNFYYLAGSLLLCILSSLMDTYIWKVSMNKHLGNHKLTFSESIAVVNASGLFKYLPGRIWIYTAQLAWLKKFNISKSKILHANLLCIIASMTVSLYLGLTYIALHTDIFNTFMLLTSFIILILLNILYVNFNTGLLNKIITIANKYFNKDIQPLVESMPLLVYIQFIYVVSWFVAGLSGYLLAKGVGLQIVPRDLFALLASMSLSWLVGYLAVITPGGLGVREGFMLLMLNRVASVQTALLFPILSRIMFLLAEAILGLVAVVIGIKHKVFSAERGQ